MEVVVRQVETVFHFGLRISSIGIQTYSSIHHLRVVLTCLFTGYQPVSYTHLDVYKRQVQHVPHYSDRHLS